MKKIVSMSVAFLLMFAAVAQEKFTISGYMKDEGTGEELIGATVFVDELGSGTAANIYGFYSITLPKGKYHLQFSFIGYQTISKEIDLTKDERIDLELPSGSKTLEAFTIESEAKDENVKSTRMSVAKLDIKEIETIPVLMGEKDILKTMQLMPGVSAAGEGNAGFYVRGGSADQNLVLLDEAPVYNSSHLLGFFSVFNSDALKDVTLYKGGIPANFGGRSSSVMDIYMKNGNNKKFDVSGGVGLIASRLTVEGPLVKGKSSFIISGRRTYADLLLKTFGGATFEDATLNFWDLNAKANITLNKNNRLFLSGYFGQDNFGFKAFGFNWGNATSTLRWNHIFSNKLFLNTSLVYSRYNYEFGIEFGEDAIKIGAGIEDWTAKMDWDYYLNPKNKLKFGINSVYHRFEPGALESENEDFNNVILDEKFALESSAYLMNEQKIGARLSANYGIRYSMFNVLGPGTVYDYDEDNLISDSATYANNEEVIRYEGWEPRLALTYTLTETSSLKASYNRMFQYLHLMSNSTAGSPTDVWVPSSKILTPMRADQVALGYFRNFKNNKYEFSVEGYYKDMQDQKDFENGADLLLNDKIEAQILNGTGFSYGAELFLKKRTGKFTGWLSYTLSKTMYQFDDINKGIEYNAKQDRTHDVSIVGMYKLNDRWDLSATWVYQTGNAITFPSGKYEMEGNLMSYYTERNGYRMPAYHRLDVGATLNNKKDAKYEWSLNLSLYNAYHQLNPYSISFEENEETGNTEAIKLSLFGIVPSITYNFKF